MQTKRRQTCFDCHGLPIEGSHTTGKLSCMQSGRRHNSNSQPAWKTLSVEFLTAIPTAHQWWVCCWCWEASIAPPTHAKTATRPSKGSWAQGPLDECHNNAAVRIHSHDTQWQCAWQDCACLKMQSPCCVTPTGPGCSTCPLLSCQVACKPPSTPPYFTITYSSWQCFGSANKTQWDPVHLHWQLPRQQASRRLPFASPEMMLSVCRDRPYNT